ncbi:condensation domain-containing protein [Streptomyces pseudovenezuelae]|uniref:Condensation domain-containing protein n=1 Tax=Streptomyces pseudovenezuelae TaxID=67350 RepID=A0ABT6M0K6_9ACTN|nr:condensation domain-containing protein [Streptomyces pseudovenezuelae]MDH6222092.1 hypothetical protein [Streptomyces pseudovenezuelae]
MTDDVQEQQPVPFTYGQDRYYAQSPGPGVSRKNVWYACEITGEFDPALFEQAVDSFVRRHDALCMDLLPTAGKDPVRAQRVRPLGVTEKTVDHQAVKASSAQQFSRYASLLLSRDFVAPWPDGGRPFKFRLLRRDGECHAFLATFQNLVFDSRALDLFSREIWRDYTALVRGESVPWTASSFAEAAHRQRKSFGIAHMERVRDSWRDRLAHEAHHSWRCPEGAVPTESGVVEEVLSGEVMDAIRETSRSAGCTVMQCIVSAFVRALYRHSGRKEVSLWTSMDSRRSAEHDVVGMFASAGPLKVCDAGAGFLDVCAEVGGQMLDALRFQQMDSQGLRTLIREFEVDGRKLDPGIFINIRQIEREMAPTRQEEALRVDSSAYPLMGISWVDTYALHLRCDEYLDGIEVSLLFDGQRVGRPLAQNIAKSLIDGLSPSTVQKFGGMGV